MKAIQRAALHPKTNIEHRHVLSYTSCCELRVKEALNLNRLLVKSCGSEGRSTGCYTSTLIGNPFPLLKRATLSYSD